MDLLDEDPHTAGPSRPTETYKPPEFTPLPVPRPYFDEDDVRDPQDSDSEDDFVTVSRAGHNSFNLPAIGLQSPMFYGKSSGVFFSRDAVYIRKEIAGIRDDQRRSSGLTADEFRRPDYWIPADVSVHSHR